MHSFRIFPLVPSASLCHCMAQCIFFSISTLVYFFLHNSFILSPSVYFSSAYLPKNNSHSIVNPFFFVFLPTNAGSSRVLLLIYLPQQNFFSIRPPVHLPQYIKLSCLSVSFSVYLPQ